MRRAVGGIFLVTCALFGQAEADLIRQWNVQLARPGLSSGERARLAGQRDDALFRLMKTAPHQARTFFQNAPVTQFEGTASALIEDDFETGSSIRKWRLRTGGEAVHEVFFASSPPDLTCESKASVEGYELRGRIVATSAAITAAAATTCSTTGVQKIAVLMVQFPSQALPTDVTKTVLTAGVFGATRSVDAFWREASYGKTSASGDVFGPFTLAADYTCDQADSIFAAALTAASATVDLTAYSRIFLIVPQRGSCAIGLGQVGCAWFSSPQGQIYVSPAWIRADFIPLAERVLAVASHEGGHNLGLDHSNTLDFQSIPLGMFKAGTDTEYADFFSIMSGLWDTTPLGYLVPHYSAPHKSLLGWFSGSNLQQVETNGTFTLLPYESPQTGLQAIKVRRGAGNNAWLWIEYRQPTGFDAVLTYYSSNVFPGAALIHYEDPGHDSLHTRVLDFNPSPPNFFSQAPMQVGTSWTDPYSLLNLKVNSASSAGLSVTVSYDTACATLSASTITSSSTAKTGSITVTAPNTCSWTAASSDTWLTIGSGSASGTGNGTVNYSIAANSVSASRAAFLVIQRQTVAVTQAATTNLPPVAGSVTPASSSGASGTFTFSYSDANGASDIQWVAARFANSSGACTVYADPVSRNLTLLADDGTTVLGPLAVNATATLENSFCRIYPANSELYNGSNSIVLTLALDFKGSGMATISGAAKDLAGAGGTFRNLGSITISCGYALGANTAAATASGGTGSVTLTTGSSCTWSASSSASWLTISGASSGTGSSTINYATTANAGASRAATLTIGGQTLTVTQATFTSVPNYAGYLDRTDCVGLSGWAADRNHLSTSSTVSIYDGTSLLGTATANQSRPDVGGLLGDAGLHGFSFALPSSVRDGRAHTLHAFFESSTSEMSGSPNSLTCSSSAAYTGWIDNASCAGITGWAADLNRPGQSIVVSLWYNGAQVASTSAAGSRSDVGSVIGDNGLHGFGINLPSANFDGVSRTYSLRFESSTTSPPGGASITLSCSGGAQYAGWVDSSGCAAISGWAADRNRLNQVISVDLLEGSTVLATVAANASRSDVGASIGDNGAHGFSVAIPASLKNGAARTIDLRFSGTSQSVGNAPKTLTCAAGAAAYSGWVDSVGCTAISGWAADRGNLNTSIGIEIYDGTALVGTLTASGSRSDVGSVLGDNGLHGFSWATPQSLKDGRVHTITVRPAGSATALQGATALSCQ